MIMNPLNSLKKKYSKITIFDELSLFIGEKNITDESCFKKYSLKIKQLM